MNTKYIYTPSRKLAVKAGITPYQIAQGIFWGLLAATALSQIWK